MKTFSIGGVTYRQQLIACGRKCSKCPNHGPYWFAAWWSKGRTITKYVGKELPEGVRAPEALPAAPEKPVPMKPRVAAKLLGISLSHPFERAQAAWLHVRHRTNKDHTKKYTDVMKIDEAWKAVCDYHGWM